MFLKLFFDKKRHKTFSGELNDDRIFKSFA